MTLFFISLIPVAIILFHVFYYAVILIGGVQILNELQGRRDKPRELPRSVIAAKRKERGPDWRRKEARWGSILMIVVTAPLWLAIGFELIISTAHWVTSFHLV